MEGARIERVETRRADLRTPFPLDFAARLEGQGVRSLRRRAKYLLAELESGDTLVMHLGMSGSFRVEPANHLPERHDHVVFDLSSGRSVVFNDPRRFGVMDLLAPDRLASHRAISGLGPEPLSAEFGAAAPR